MAKEDIAKIKQVVGRFAKANCEICVGKGVAMYVDDSGHSVLNAVCSCAQNNYRRKMEKAVAEPCKDCGVVNRFCDHRPMKLMAYAKRQTDG